MKLVGIPPGDLEAVAKLVPALQGFARESGGKWTCEGLVAAISRGVLQLWGAVREDGSLAAAAALSEVHITLGGERWARMVAAGGAPLAEWVHLAREWIAMSREAGFHGVEIVAPAAWARLLRDEVKETHRVLEARFS